MCAPSCARWGHPYLDRLDDALRVLRALADHTESPLDPGGAIKPPLSLSSLDQAARLPAGPFTAPEALALVAAVGVPVPNAAVVSNLADAAAAANRLGYPVALKLVSRGVSHKSDRGGVRLGLADAAQVRAADRDIARVFSSR